MCPDTPPPEFSPQILVLCCRQALADDAALESALTSPLGFTARQLLVPCTAKIETHYLLKYLERGVDGIEIIGCPDKECRFLNGIDRTKKRVERARQLLVQAGMNPDRIGMDHGTGLTADQVKALVEARAGEIRQLGSNPMKREHAK